MSELLKSEESTCFTMDKIGCCLLAEDGDVPTARGRAAHMRDCQGRGGEAGERMRCPDCRRTAWGTGREGCLPSITSGPIGQHHAIK